MKRISFVLIAGISASLLLTGCGGGSQVAKVNGVAISSEEFADYMMIKTSIRIATDSGEVAEASIADTIGFQAMQDMVNMKLLLQMAKEAGIEVKPADVDAEIKFKTAIQPTYIGVLQNRGLSMKQIRKNVEIEIAQERLLTKGINIPMAEVDRYVKENPKLLVDPEKATMEILLVRAAAAKAEVDRELASRTSFSTVRQKFDETPAAVRNRFENSRLTGEGLPVSELDPQIRGPVKATREGSTTNWIKLDSGWVKLLVHKKTPEKKIELTAERKEFIRRRMALERGRAANDFTKKLGDMLRAAKVEVSETGLKDPWKRYQERLAAAAAPKK